ncbi:19892_t:CDS:1, partial [Gigaspora rosea]
LWKQILKKRVKKQNMLIGKQIPSTSSATTLPQALFPELDKALSQFITPKMQKV